MIRVVVGLHVGDDDFAIRRAVLQHGDEDPVELGGTAQARDDDC